MRHERVDRGHVFGVAQRVLDDLELHGSALVARPEGSTTSTDGNRWRLRLEATFAL